MTLQPESKRELKRIAGGTALCTAAMWVIFAALHLVGGPGSTIESCWAAWEARPSRWPTSQASASWCRRSSTSPDEKRRKAKLQLSHNGRMLMQAVWVVVAIAAPCFQPFASVLPLFFPRITIYYLQITGKYKPLAPPSGGEVSVEDDPAPAAAAAQDPGDEGGET